jgi:hypothetical protein
VCLMFVLMGWCVVSCGPPFSQSAIRDDQDDHDAGDETKEVWRLKYCLFHRGERFLCVHVFSIWIGQRVRLDSGVRAALQRAQKNLFVRALPRPLPLHRFTAQISFTTPCHELKVAP